MTTSVDSSRYPTADPLVALDVQRLSDGVVEVTLLGPGKGNAMGPDFWAEVPVLFAALDADDSVRAVVITGSGSNFCFGLDLAAYATLWGSMLAEDGGLARPRTRLHDQVRTMQTIQHQAGTAIAVHDVDESRGHPVTLQCRQCHDLGMVPAESGTVQLDDCVVSPRVNVRLTPRAELGSQHHSASVVMSRIMLPTACAQRRARRCRL